jgi:metal-responsive CopG/Arc/MetJ family transcriptional regulator
MTRTGIIGRPKKAPAEQRQRVSFSIPGALFTLLERLKEYPGQERSEVVQRLILEEARRRELIAS